MTEENCKIIEELLQEILAEYKKLSKRVDKVASLNTKIAKSLHLLPVTEKEERDIQLLQRKNLGLAAKVSSDLDAMAPDTSEAPASLFSPPEYTNREVFEDVLADDFLGGSV